jgi:hypothetical protein
MSRTVDELEIVLTVALAGDTATAEAKPADSANAPMVVSGDVLSIISPLVTLVSPQ